ncbi:MAG: type II secretion system protein [Alphaproteobacteria bacterium]
MKKENKNQIVVSRLTENPVGNKDINTAGCPFKSGMTGGHFTQHIQSGRSMVEMLGVLAIMGVLSVGGVSMYSSAMNKHRANEILNEASKRAVMVAGQLLSNPEATTMSLAQFGNETVAGTTFGEEATISNGKIMLGLSGIENEICTQMKAAIGDDAAMLINDTCTILTFNADMSKGVTTGGTPPSDGYTEDDGSDCSADYSLGPCQVCVQGAYVDSDAKCDSSQICVDGACKTPDDYGYYTGCTRNSECTGMQNGIDCDSKTCYCSYTTNQQDEWASSGPQKSSGVCMEAAYQKTTAAEDGIAGKLSTQIMDWYSAKNFCNALGGSMISLKECGIDKSKLESFFNNTSVCRDSECEGVDWSIFKGKLSYSYWWTKDLKNGAGSEMAFDISPGMISTDYRAMHDEMGLGRIFGAYALCK